MIVETVSGSYRKLSYFAVISFCFRPAVASAECEYAVSCLKTEQRLFFLNRSTHMRVMVQNRGRMCSNRIPDLYP